MSHELFRRKHVCASFTTIWRRQPEQTEKLLLRLAWTVNMTDCVFPFFPVASAVRLHGCYLTLPNVPLSYLFFSFQSICFFFFILIIFSHFLHPITAVKWPIVKEQTVCVWDISCWFSGTLAWWMARQKTPNNSWFASGETCSLRRNTVQHSHLLCSVSNDDGRGTVLQRMKPWVLYSSKLAVLEHFNSYYPGLFVKYIGH